MNVSDFRSVTSANPMSSDISEASLNCLPGRSWSRAASAIAATTMTVICGGAIVAQSVPFMGAELGRDADPFMLHLYAALAEEDVGSYPSVPKLRWRPIRLQAHSLAILATSRTLANWDAAFKLQRPTNLSLA